MYLGHSYGYSHNELWGKRDGDLCISAQSAHSTFAQEKKNERKEKRRVRKIR